LDSLCISSTSFQIRAVVFRICRCKVPECTTAVMGLFLMSLFSVVEHQVQQQAIVLSS